MASANPASNEQQQQHQHQQQEQTSKLQFLPLLPTTCATYNKLTSPPVSPSSATSTTSDSTTSSRFAVESPVLAATGIVVPGSQPNLDRAALENVDIDSLKLRSAEQQTKDRNSDTGKGLGSGFGMGSAAGSLPGRRFLRLGPVHGAGDVEGEGRGCWSETIV